MRRFLAATVAAGAATTGLTIASAIVLAHIVAGVITDPAKRSPHVWTTALAVLAVLWIARAAVSWAGVRLSQRGATAVITELGGQLLHDVTNRSPREAAADRDEAGAVITRGLDALRPYFTAYLPALVLSALLTPAAVVVISVYDLRSALIVAVALPLVPLFMILIGLATRDRSAAALAAMGVLQARLLDLVAGIPTLRALGRASGPAARIAEISAAHRRTTMSTLRIAFLSALVLELIATLGVALVAVSVGLRLVYGEMSLVAGLTALLLAPEVFWPLRRVGVEFHAAAAGKAAAERAFELLDESPEPPADSSTVDARGARIEIDGLSVAGRDGVRPHGLCADIEPGRITVLAGPNGSGKSTALQAILGIIEPTSGCVRVAGVDVASLQPRQWWSQVAWLAQRPALIAGSVAENLNLFGELNDPLGACAQAGFDEVIAGLPDGLLTVLGPGGVGLSAGQRQRLGLARALGSRAPVLLLDEPTAHLDAENEQRVLAALAQRADAGTTVVLTGHRRAVLDAAHSVVMVGEGADVYR
ncbi:thiol reductant ABC exporter subunit CydD [Mycolicibacterium stellerae]|uniref:thiol reductant ABC exporter subunit CydD n=1 Tax=Mycolicibacterium stellerae TaxID=2358193 RepID=UPI000F0BBB10|nr:thiol reductant ABC exporter subunit CydD [Mycolicibacterium stellerae]